MERITASLNKKVFLIFMLLSLVACGGGSDSGSPAPQPTANQPDFDNDGIVDSQDLDDDNDGINDQQDFFPFDRNLPAKNQILTNRLTQANIQLIDPLSNSILTSFSTTSSQSDFENAPSFVFPADQISFTNDDPKWYLLKVSGGFDVDADNDGLNDTNPVSNDGEFEMLVSKEQIRVGGVNVNVFGDVVIKGVRNYASNEFEYTQQRLDHLSGLFVTDINNDGDVNYQDILDFEPLSHSELTLQPYSNYVEMYIAPILSNDLTDKTSRILMLLDIEWSISESPQIDLYKNGEVKSIGNIQIDNGDITITTSRATSLDEVTVSSFITTSDGMSAKLVFMAENAQTFFMDPESFAELSALKAVKNNQGVRLTIPKELMASWAASEPLVQSGLNDVNIIVVEDDPIVDLIFGDGDYIRLINSELGLTNENAIQLSADSYNEFTAEPINIRYQLQFVLRNVDEDVRIFGSTSIFEDDSFLFFGLNDPIVTYTIDFLTSRLSGLGSDVRIQMGLSSEGEFQWFARDLETLDYLDGNVQPSELGYFTGQFTDFNSGFFNQDAEIGVNARLFRLGLNDPLPSVNAKPDESVNEIKILAYDDAEFTVTGFSDGPWELGETVRIDFMESGIPQDVELALFYLVPNASCSAPNCLAKMKAITSTERSQGYFEWEVSDWPLDSEPVSFDSQFESKFCVRRANFTGGFSTCNDIAVLVDSSKMNMSVTVSGEGSITSMPIGIDCETKCDAVFAKDTLVTLSAEPKFGYALLEWQGACSGSNTTCTVLMNNSRNVTARFEKRDYILDLRKYGAGEITSNPTKVMCTGLDYWCETAFPAGTVVTLTARSAPDTLFQNWSKDCTGNKTTCTIVMDGHKAVSAHFKQDLTKYSLSVTVVGQGTVTSSPSGINCRTDCSEEYTVGSTVVLTASPADGYDFIGWDGQCVSVNSNNCTVEINQSKNIGARFESTSTAATITITSQNITQQTSLEVSVSTQGITFNFTCTFTADTSGYNCGSPVTYVQGDTYTTNIITSNGQSCSASPRTGTLVGGSNIIALECEEESEPPAFNWQDYLNGSSWRHENILAGEITIYQSSFIMTTPNTGTAKHYYSRGLLNKVPTLQFECSASFTLDALNNKSQETANVTYDINSISCSDGNANTMRQFTNANAPIAQFIRISENTLLIYDSVKLSTRQ